uniref:Uncharacterized protein n=1 Tax=Oryza brachyantha TaxID=4533 RepID=J3MAK3_ORYBR
MEKGSSILQAWRNRDKKSNIAGYKNETRSRIAIHEISRTVIMNTASETTPQERIETQ